MNDENNLMAEVNSIAAKAQKLMVLLHGVGSDGDDLISLVPFINNDLPDYHFIAPNGVEPYDMAPFGYQWFSLQNRALEALIPQISKNAEIVKQIIAQKQQELGLFNKDTVLFGFSQGTMMNSYLTLSAKDDPYHAMIGFSGRLISTDDDPNVATPICLVHGVNDQVVPSNESQKFAEYCHKHNIKHQLKLIPNLNHSIDAEGIRFAINFLKNI